MDEVNQEPQDTLNDPYYNLWTVQNPSSQCGHHTTANLVRRGAHSTLSTHAVSPDERHVAVIIDGGRGDAHVRLLKVHPPGFEEDGKILEGISLRSFRSDVKSQLPPLPNTSTSSSDDTWLLLKILQGINLITLRLSRSDDGVIQLPTFPIIRTVNNDTFAILSGSGRGTDRPGDLRVITVSGKEHTTVKLPSSATDPLTTSKKWTDGSAHVLVPCADGKVLDANVGSKVVSYITSPKFYDESVGIKGRYTVALSPDGQTMAAVTQVGELHFWDLRTREFQHTYHELVWFDSKAHFLGLWFNPVGPWILVLSEKSGHFLLVDYEKNEILTKMALPTAPVGCCVCVEEGRFALEWAMDGNSFCLAVFWEKNALFD